MQSLAPNALLIRSTIAIMLFATLPHFSHCPWWLGILIFCIIGYRAYLSYHPRLMIPRWIIVLFMVIIPPLLFYDYGRPRSGLFFIGLLITFFWLKLFEARTLRDFKSLTLILFFVVFTALIAHHSLWIIPYLALAISATLFLMVLCNAPDATSRSALRLVFKYSLMALPLSLVLYLVFPRFDSPFWGVPLKQGQFGFSEQLTPGSLSELFDNDRTAMRVRFNRRNTQPLYFKGLYLSRYNGFSWTPLPLYIKPFRELPLALQKDATTYDVLLEPNQYRWLFYTETPVAANPVLNYSPALGLTLQSKKPVRQRLAYRYQSGKSKYSPLSAKEHLRNTQIPRTGNPKLRAWVKAQQQKIGTHPQAIIALIHHHIRTQNYWYRLKPKPIGRDRNAIDTFWFSTQEGYCEHYASAVAYLLRAANIPARIVVGYYGGEWNPVANYLTIRQQNAHAWVEYWEEHYGWQRLDPTTFIAPQRVDATIRALNARNQQFIKVTDWEQAKSQFSWIIRLKLSLESSRYFFEKWLLYYNAERQQELLNNVGINHWNWVRLTQITLASILCFMALGTLALLWKTRQKNTPLIKAHKRLRKTLHRLGIKPHPGQTLRQQMQAVSALHPELSEKIARLLSAYERLRYQQNKTEHRQHHNKAVGYINRLNALIKPMTKSQLTPK